MISIKPWLLASRPKTLPAAIAPVIIGTALAFADAKVHWLAALCAALGAIFIQIGTNYANDYFDFVKGTDTEDRLGPTRATAAGMVSPTSMKVAFIIAFTLAAIAGLFLIYRGGWPIVIIGALSILSGILYTGGPYPLGYNGLGDIFVLIFFGFVAVGGTYYVQTLEINTIVLLAGLAPGLFSTAILTVNNLRDIKADTEAGKKTLAVRFGKQFTRHEYFLSMFFACLSPIYLVYWTNAHYYSLIAVVVFILAWPSIKFIYQNEPGVEMNKILAKTGQLLFLYSLIFSIGWIL